MNTATAAPAGVPAVEPPLLAGLIRSELTAQLGQLRKSLAEIANLQAYGLVNMTPGASATFAAVLRQGGTLATTMEMLAGLADTYAGPGDDSRERFFLFSLLGEIVQPKGRAPQERFVLSEPGRDVAPVYGNRRWLTLMLTYLLQELDRTIPPDGQRIALSLRQLGNHMILRGQIDSASQRGRSPAKPAPSPIRRVDGINFGFCKRIAELHGGSLRLDLDEDEGSEELLSFTLSLPTSSPMVAAPIHCATCPLLGQIENYAADLAELMDRCQDL